MSEIENGSLGLHGTEHSKCKHLTTPGFKGLNRAETSIFSSHTHTRAFGGIGADMLPSD